MNTLNIRNYLDPELEKIELGIINGDNTELKKIIFHLLNTLRLREKEVIKYRFFQNLTLEEIATKYNRTRERIRQIEKCAIRRLRHPSRARRLIDYIK